MKALIGDDRFPILSFILLRRDVPPDDDDFSAEDLPDGWEVTSKEWRFEFSKTGVTRRRTAESNEDEN